MNKLLALLTIFGLSVAVLLWQTVQALGDAQPMATVPAGFAVVELFTSEGCSSCPPADEVLSELVSAGRENVIPLSFHVDYWNDLGWRDPFSAAAYSARQRRHAEVLGERRVYTPQVVINGRVEAVGSRRSQIEALLARVLGEPTASPAKIELSARADGEHRVTVSHHVQGAPAGTELTLLLVQVRASSLVSRGENASLQLTHSNVVRVMKSATSGEHTSLTIPDGLAASELSVVALLEDARTLATVAAARVSVLPRL